MPRGHGNGSPRPLISIFQTRSRYFSLQVAPQLSSRGWVDNALVYLRRILVSFYILNYFSLFSAMLCEEHIPRLCENRMLSRMTLKRTNVTGEWSKFRNEEFHSLCSPPDIIMMMTKSRRVKWTGLGPNWVGVFPPHLRTETNPVSER
jgi:hypothetical protein